VPLQCRIRTDPSLQHDGSVLLLNPPSPASPNKIVIIDWELAQYGHFAYDLGQLIGDLCENQLLDSPQTAKWTIEGFIRGYGGLSDELAFRTAIHAGVHFIHWYVRRPPTAEMLETPEKIADAMKLGRDIVVNGWKKTGLGSREPFWLLSLVFRGCF
jgi:hypothetical protein